MTLNRKKYLYVDSGAIQYLKSNAVAGNGTRIVYITPVTSKPSEQDLNNDLKARLKEADILIIFMEAIFKGLASCDCVLETCYTELNISGWLKGQQDLVDDVFMSVATLLKDGEAVLDINRLTHANEIRNSVHNLIKTMMPNEKALFKV